MVWNTCSFLLLSVLWLSEKETCAGCEQRGGVGKCGLICLCLLLEWQKWVNVLPSLKIWIKFSWRGNWIINQNFNCVQISNANLPSLIVVSCFLHSPAKSPPLLSQQLGSGRSQFFKGVQMGIPFEARMDRLMPVFLIVSVLHCLLLASTVVHVNCCLTQTCQV